MLEAVQQELNNCPHVYGRKLSVSVEGGVIAITGTVRNYYSKQMAGEAVMAFIRQNNLPMTVQNRLKVEPETVAA